MKLDEALEQLDAITAVTDRTSTFDGLRSFPTTVTAVLAMLGAGIQSQFMTTFERPLTGYLLLWVGVAVISLCVVLSGMMIRYYRDPTARARRMTLDVLARLSPAIVVGGALTAIIYLSSPEVAWMLPGLWAVLLGLGIFAASSLLPRQLQQVGIWYIACGLAVLIMAHGEHSLSPFAMAVPFGCGQSLAAWLMRRVKRSQTRFAESEVGI